jgi:NAD(P)-dependent dehydrogenase (short-subunit alcohol dehydrogenase family)
VRLKDKVIIVTGSTTGIGKAIARKCVDEGARVVIHGLEHDLGRQVVEEIGAQRSALHISDLATQGAAEKLIDSCIHAFGQLDALVNNAAWVVSSDVTTTDTAFLRKVLEVNTIAPFELIQLALPHLKRKYGSILNIGSVNAWSGEPNLLAYSMSKGALTTMTRNLGDVLFREHGVRVNQINPGWVLTEKEIVRKKEQGYQEEWFKHLPPVFAPGGRLFSPEEIATAAVYFLSKDSGPVSGQVLDIEQYPMIGRNPPKDV